MDTSALPNSHDKQWLVEGGEMGELIRSIDWSAHPLGPLESWPHSLRTTVNLCLSSNFPINILWGPGSYQIYNDGYRVIVGEKHPAGMGMGYKECWESAWPEVGQPFERAWAGETSYIEDRRMFVERGGYLEETFFTFSLSPIRDERGIVAGLFLPVTETRTQMLGQRRTKALGELAANTAKARTIEECFESCAETFTEHSLDLPFVLLYSISGDGAEARLVASAGVERGLPVSPAQVRLAEEADRSWRLADILAADSLVEISGLKARFGEFACGPYPEGANLALARALRVPGVNAPLGIVIAGTSPRLPFGQEYRDHVELVANGVATALGNALAYQRERQRAEALAEIDRAKTAFFSNVSHEFRTPLTLMLGPLEEELRENPDSSERLRIAHRNSLRLLKLVNTLLDFARIEAGRAKGFYEPTDLRAVTIDLASHFRSAIESAGLDFRVDCSPIEEPVYVDREMWEKIVLNLLSNAFKFTFTGGVSVQLHAGVGRQIELIVSDTGIGIPQNELAHIFERFHRVQATQGRTHEGTGIGLALVRELAQLHGGTVTVESIPGKGSAFKVTLPLGKDHLPPEQVGAARDLASTAIRAEAFVEEALRWLPEEAGAVRNGSSAVAEFEPEPSCSQVDGHSERVLVVDDNADMRDHLRRLLADRYDVSAAANGEEAFQRALAEDPDLVLADVMMPKLDGFGLLRALRSDSRTKTIPVVLLSARAGEEARSDGIDAGADDYIVKPFSARELLARVGSRVRQARLRKADEALRRSLAEKEALLKEVHHRVKNNLQVISSLVNLQASRAEDRQVIAAFEETRNRVYSIGTIHEMLYSSGSLASIDLADYARKLVPELIRFYGAQERVRVEIGGDTMTLELERAVPFGLILNELVSNVCKHAFPRGKAGSMVVSFAYNGGSLAMSVSDSGVGLPSGFEYHKATSLGLQLVRSLAHQLRATVGVHSENGTKITVTIPVQMEYARWTMTSQAS